MFDFDLLSDLDKKVTKLEEEKKPHKFEIDLSNLYLPEHIGGGIIGRGHKAEFKEKNMEAAKFVTIEFDPKSVHDGKCVVFETSNGAFGSYRYIYPYGGFIETYNSTQNLNKRGAWADNEKRLIINIHRITKGFVEIRVVYLDLGANCQMTEVGDCYWTKNNQVVLIIPHRKNGGEKDGFGHVSGDTHSLRMAFHPIGVTYTIPKEHFFKLDQSIFEYNEHFRFPSVDDKHYQCSNCNWSYRENELVRVCTPFKKPDRKVCPKCLDIVLKELGDNKTLSEEVNNMDLKERLYTGVLYSVDEDGKAQGEHEVLKNVMAANSTKAFTKFILDNSEDIKKIQGAGCVPVLDVANHGNEVSEV